jgi:hypothetical protein
VPLYGVGGVKGKTVFAGARTNELKVRAVV